MATRYYTTTVFGLIYDPVVGDLTTARFLWARVFGSCRTARADDWKRDWEVVKAYRRVFPALVDHALSIIIKDGMCVFTLS